MKKYLLIFLTTLYININYAQTVVASLGVGSTPNSIKIYLRPTITSAAAVFSTLQFTVALPASISPIPTVNVISTAFAAAAPAAWTVEPPYTENGYLVYPIFTAVAGFTLPVTAGTEFVAMEVSFGGGPAGNFANAAHIICLPEGGTGGTGSAYFFCSGTLNSNGSNLFYARDGAVSVANGFSYRYINPTDPFRPAGTFTSYARLITPIALPVKFTYFSAYKSNNNCVLNWYVENISGAVKYFEIERSFDGRNFEKIGTKNPGVLVNNAANYEYTDVDVFASYKGIVYYRIKEVDNSGEVTYSVIKSLKSDNKGFALSLYPNPVVEKVNIVFSKDKAEPVVISIWDMFGHKIKEYNYEAQKGLNNQQININEMAIGTYILKLVTNSETQTITFVKGE